MPRVKKYHEGGKGPGHPHYTIDNKAERQAADAADYYDRYPERRPEAIAKKKEERGTLFDSAADFFQYSPIIGEIVDLLNIPYVAATGKDVYKGEPQSVQSAAAWGVGGLLLPNLIEKPAKWLIKQGAKNADDVASILRHFSNRNAEDIPADLKPLLNFSKKNNEMRAFLSDKSPGFPFAGMDNVGSNKLKDVGGDLHDYIVKNRPDLIDKFSVKNFESGMFDEVTRAWGDEYLVSLRGVRDAKNVDEAADFLTSAKGGGERVQGPGINTSGSLNQVEPFGSGSQGYIGRLKVNEPYSSSANASTILDNIYNLEKEGGKLIPKSDDSRFLSKSGVTEGINTIDGTQVRVIKENTPVTVEDIIKTEGNDLSKIFRNPSEVTILGNPSVRNADYDKILDWTRSSGGDLNELYNTVLKKGSYKQGGKALKGLMKKYNEGGLFQKLRDKRAKRRLGRTNVRNFPTGEVLESLAGTNPYSGYFRPDTRDVYMSPVTGDKSVMDHELIHSTQMGPLQQMADALGFNAGRIQDKNSRKAFRKLYRSIKKEDTILDDLYRKQQIEQGRKGNEIRSGLGDYMMGKKAQDIEFDAIIKSGLSSAANKGLDLSNKTFDEVLNELNQTKSSESTNMHHLRRFMNDTSWTDKQKVFIMDAIKANVGRKEYTVKDVKQDLR